MHDRNAFGDSPQNLVTAIRNKSIQLIKSMLTRSPELPKYVIHTNDVYNVTGIQALITFAVDENGFSADELETAFGNTWWHHYSFLFKKRDLMSVLDLVPVQDNLAFLTMHEDMVAEIKPSEMYLLYLRVRSEWSEGTEHSEENLSAFCSLFNSKRLNQLLFKLIKNHNSIDDILTILKFTDMNLNTRLDKIGNTLLHAAVLKKNLSVLQALLAKPDINANVQRKDGQTPLMLAVSLSGTDYIYNEMIKALSSASHSNTLTAFDPKKPPAKSDNPLFSAILNQDKDEVSFQLEILDVDPNKTVEFFTPLAMAVKVDNKEIVELLLQAPKIDVNYAPKCGQTPLEIACAENNTEMVKLLLTAPRIDVSKGMSLNYAVVNHNQFMIQALLLHMKKDFLKDDQVLEKVLKKVSQDQTLSVLTKDEQKEFKRKIINIEKMKRINTSLSFFHQEQTKRTQDGVRPVSARMSPSRPSQ